MPKKDRTSHYKEKKRKEQSENKKRYQNLRKEYLEKQPTCELCKNSRANQIHHKARQKGFNRFRFFMAICPECHIWIHDHATEARELGYIFDYDPKEENIFGEEPPVK